MLPKVIVVEPNMNGSAHSEVNAGLLSIISRIYSSYWLGFIADKRHVTNIENKTSLDAYQKKYIKVFDYAPKFFLINEIILIFRLLKILILSKKTDVIYLLGIMPISHIVLSFFNILLKRKVIIVLHGQIEALLPNTKIGKTKYYYKISQFVFKIKDHLRYIVFGESVKNNIAYLFRDKDKMITIDQPYIYPEQLPNTKKDEKQIVLGIIGRADNTKNIQAFYEFIEKIQSEILSQKIKVKVVGKLSGLIPEKCVGKFSYFTEKIDDEIMMKEIQTLDYALSFTDNSYYRAIPSGTFFDCIKWEIPILGLKNDFISHYFRKYGEVGKIFDTIDDMVSFIRCLEYQKQEDQYTSIFQRLKNDLSIDNLTRKLESQL